MEKNKKINLPVMVKYSPIRKLAIIPFEKCPDTFYKGFEIQYIDGEPYGTGYRLLAYRNDDYVDVYDDMTLNYIEDEKFNVVINGLNKHVQTPLSRVRFCKVGNNQIISFELVDIQNRKITVHIEEQTKKKSKSMNLLAPIGAGSKNPEFLPVFFLYEFDLMRKKKSIVRCNIDGKDIKIDSFPMPINGQSRLYARYSNECEMIEFAEASMTELKEIELDENNTYCDGNIKYSFDEEFALKNIIVHIGEHDVNIFFEAGVNLYNSCISKFTIIPREQMGYIQGEYNLEYGDNTAKFCMIPKDGWISRPNSFITRFIMGKKSIFCSWSKKYMYEAKIDLSTKKVDAYWKNGNSN